MTFPAAPPGTTHWIIGGSISGIPQGPWYRLTNVAIVPVATAFVDIDFVNGELGALMAINYDVPPAATHCAALGAVMLALGTGTGGYGVRSSIVAQPEAFPLEYGFDLPVRESITGVQPGLDGIVLVSTRNGLMGLLLSGSANPPVLSRVIFGNVGFDTSNAYTSVYNQIYGFSSKAGAVRTQGSEEPDSSFAFPVQKYFELHGFTSSNTKVIQDQAHDAVIYASGNKAVPYMRAINRWSAPITLPGTVSAGIALNGLGHLQIGSTVYALDQAAAGTSWFLRGPYFGDSLNVKVAKEFRAGAIGAVTYDLQVPNADWSAPVSIGGVFPYTVTPPFGAAGSRVKKPNRRFRAACLKASGTTGGESPLPATLSGYEDQIAA